jgi:uncharacterized damage-inducible protein DinB
MAARRPLDLGRELLEEFDRCARVTEYLASVIPTSIWRADPPGGEARPVGRGGGRSIAAIVAHMQGVRRTFAKMGGADPVPPTLDRAAAGKPEAVRALKESRKALTTLFSTAFAEGRGRVPRLPRRTVNMMLYLIQHDAHHRGQITMIARALGHEFSGADVMRIWGWKKLP